MTEIKTLQALAENLAKKNGSPAVLALQKEDIQRWSYTKLAEYVDRLAQGLKQAGVEKGTHVALLSGTRPEWFAACLATLRAGAVIVPIDVQFADKALEHVLSDSEPQIIFTTSEQMKRLEELDLNKEKTCILLDADKDDENSWRQYLKDGDAEFPEAEPDDIATLFYTSGTTGKPKGVPLTHANLAFQVNSLMKLNLVTEEDRVLLPLPLHHVYPFVIGVLTPMALGLAVVLPQALTGPQLVRAIREGEVTLLVGVPRLYRALFDALESRAREKGMLALGLLKSMLWLSKQANRVGIPLGKFLLGNIRNKLSPRLRLLASGGSPLDPDLAEKLEALGWEVGIGYGLTETSPLLTLRLPGKGSLQSVGKPIEGIEIRMEPVEMEEESKEEMTEVQARGKGVFAGYHNLPDKTEEAFTEDGWFRTGDLGFLDKRGYLHITGRASTMIVTEGGENIQPDNVEEAYEKAPAIREIGVFQKDKQLVGVVVPDPKTLREQDGDIKDMIRKAVEEQGRKLPSYQRLGDFAVSRDALPRTRLGKIRRHLLEDRFEQAKKEKPDEAQKGPMSVEEMSSEDRTLLEEPAAWQVWDWLAEQYRDQRLTPDTSPELDLGIDSMEWLNITMEIGQRTGVELSDEAIGRIDTVRDLLREVVDQSGSEEGSTITKALEQPEEYLDDKQKRWLRPLNPMQAAVARAGFSCNRAVMRACFRVRAEGRENLPEEGPFVFAPNHVSYLDPFVLGAALNNDLLRQTSWAGWTGTAFKNFLVRSVSQLAQVVPIDPQRAVSSSLAFGAAVLKQKRNLVWFPEGERAPEGKLLPFKPGIGLLLDKHPVPVVPVYIHGAYEALPMGKAWPRFTAVTVVFGEPVDAETLEQEGEGESAHDRIANALHERVAKLAERFAQGEEVTVSK